MTSNINTAHWSALQIGSKQEVPSKLPVLFAAYLECRTSRAIPSDASVMLGEDPLTKISSFYFPPESEPLALRLGAKQCDKPEFELANIITDAPGL